MHVAGKAQQNMEVVPYLKLESGSRIAKLLAFIIMGIALFVRNHGLPWDLLFRAANISTRTMRCGRSAAKPLKMSLCRIFLLTIYRYSGEYVRRCQDWCLFVRSNSSLNFSQYVLE